MYTLRDITGSDISKWDELISSMPGGTIFHTLEWLRLIERNQPIRVRKVGMFRDGEWIGAFPLCLKRFLFIKVAGSPFIVEDTPYMGPVLDPSHILDLLPPLDDYVSANRIAFLRVISNQAYRVKTRYRSYNFIIKHTHLLDITRSEETLWKNLEGRCRTAIRKAQKASVVINEIADRGFIENYYSMIEDVYHAQHMPCPNKKAFYYDMWDSFASRHAVFLSATYHGEVIGGIIILVDGKRAYYLNGASKHAFRSLSATNLLLWEAIRLSKQRGVERFDFVGSDIPRLAKFKKNFGGQLVAHSLVEKASSPWIYRLRSGYPYYKQKVGNLISLLDRLPFPLKRF